MYFHSPSEVPLNRFWGPPLFFFVFLVVTYFVGHLYVSKAQKEVPTNKTSITLTDKNKLHTEENLNVSPRLIVSRPAAGEPALFPCVRSSALPAFRCEANNETPVGAHQAKALQKHTFCFCEFFFFFFEALHIQTFHFVKAVSLELQSKIMLK